MISSLQETPVDLPKHVPSPWYQIKSLMTSKDPGHFLPLLPGAETPACWTACLASEWTDPRGSGLHVVQEVKAARSERRNHQALALI